jgi:GT2 family glycosyltransferase
MSSRMCEKGTKGCDVRHGMIDMIAPKVDYVIADWQTPDLAKRAMASLSKSGIEYTARIIDAHLLGLSYSQAIHRGVAEGGAPIVCALNADVECRGSQQGILALFESDPSIAIIGPLQTDARGLVKHGGILGTNAAPEHRGWNESRELADGVTNTEDAVTVSGSVLYARRSVWDELGGFLDTRHYYEETWFCYLARARGYRVVYTGVTDWLHHWNASPVDDMQKREWFLESQAVFRAACAAEGIECD